MNHKTRSAMKLVAIIIVLLMVMMELDWVIVPFLVAYKFWLMVIAFGLVLLATK